MSDDEMVLCVRRGFNQGFSAGRKWNCAHQIRGFDDYDIGCGLR